jgi:hypothetical protein
LKKHRPRNHDALALYHIYKDRTGTKIVDAKEAAAFAIKTLGVKVPPPRSDVERLAERISRAAAQESKTDPVLKLPYRANHQFPGIRNGVQTTLWLDIDEDEASFDRMRVSLTLRRESMVDDGYHITCDAMHWNRIHPGPQQLALIMDITEDIEERLSGNEPGQDAS